MFENQDGCQHLTKYYYVIKRLKLLGSDIIRENWGQSIKDFFTLWECKRDLA